MSANTRRGVKDALNNDQRGPSEGVDFALRQGHSEWATAGVAHATSRIDNERERRRGVKDAPSEGPRFRGP